MIVADNNGVLMITTMNTDNLLARSVTVELTRVKSQISSRKKLLQTMASLLCAGLKNETKEKEIYFQLWEREKLGNTGIGNGVALPHSRCIHAHDAVIAIITLDEAVNYDASDGQGVNLAFGLLVPQDANQEHLQLLATIARLVSDTQKKNALCEALTAQEVVTKVKQWST